MTPTPAASSPWHVNVLVAVPAGREAAEIMDVLADAVPSAVVSHPRPNLPVSVRTVVDAPTVARAVTAATAAVAVAKGLDVVGVEVLTPAVFDENERHPYVPPLVAQAEISRAIGASPARGGQLVREQPDLFPVATTTESGRPLFYRGDLDAFLRLDRHPGRRPVAAAG